MQELFEYSIILGVFHDALSQLMSLATIYDFSSKDLTAPTPERVRRILSGLINFVLFQNEQAQQVLYPLEDRLDELGRQQETLARENAETERAIQERQCACFLSSPMAVRDADVLARQGNNKRTKSSKLNVSKWSTISPRPSSFDSKRKKSV